MSDIVTVLECMDGSRANKIHRMTNGVVETEAFRAGWRFVPHEVSVSSIKDMASLLQNLATKPNAFIVRGQWDGIAPCKRRYKGDGANFEDVDRRWVCLDVDGYEGTLEQLLKELPQCFQDVTCFYQYSSSYGVHTDKLSVHLWYWLDRAVCNASWREFAKTTTMIDPMLYNPVQPHYTANPAFEGFEDPIEDRVGLLVGASDVVCVPDELLSKAEHDAKIEKLLLERREKANGLVTTVGQKVAGGTNKERYILQAIENEIALILNVGSYGRNNRVWESSCSVGNFLPHLSQSMHHGIITRLKAAAEAVAGDGWDGGDMVERGLEQGMTCPRCIDHVLEKPDNVWKVDELFERLKIEAFY